MTLRNWLFNMYGVTAEKNSNGEGTGSSAPAANKFQVEKGVVTLLLLVSLFQDRKTVVLK